MFRIQKRNIALLLAVFLAVFLLSGQVSAHSGRTDSSGGHNCNVGSCAGTYHYHNGGGYRPPAPTYTPPVKPVTVTPKPVVAPVTTPTSSESLKTQPPVKNYSSSPAIETKNNKGGIDSGWYVFLGLLALFNIGNIIDWVKEKFKK